jgi:hypothetical protein
VAKSLQEILYDFDLHAEGMELEPLVRTLQSLKDQMMHRTWLTSEEIGRLVVCLPAGRYEHDDWTDSPTGAGAKRICRKSLES